MTLDTRYDKQEVQTRNHISQLSRFQCVGTSIVSIITYSAPPQDADFPAILPSERSKALLEHEFASGKQHP